MSLFDLYHLERRSEALSVVRRLRLLPAAPDQLEACLTRFSRLQEEVGTGPGYGPPRVHGGDGGLSGLDCEVLCSSTYLR